MRRRREGREPPPRKPATNTVVRDTVNTLGAGARIVLITISVLTLVQLSCCGIALLAEGAGSPLVPLAALVLSGAFVAGLGGFRDAHAELRRRPSVMTGALTFAGGTVVTAAVAAHAAMLDDTFPTSDAESSVAFVGPALLFLGLWAVVIGLAFERPKSQPRRVYGRRQKAAETASPDDGA